MGRACTGRWGPSTARFGAFKQSALAALKKIALVYPSAPKLETTQSTDLIVHPSSAGDLLPKS